MTGIIVYPRFPKELMPLPSDSALELPLHLAHLLPGLGRLAYRFSDLDLSIRSSGVEIEACGLTCISAIGIGFTHPVLPTRGCIIRPHEDPDLGLTLDPPILLEAISPTLWA